MNKWFNDVFLPSIFERCGSCKSLWLSQKQTAVCVDNMKKRVCTESDGVYTYRHYNFVCEWSGRSVVLSYSKKNGCGSISFGMSEEERKQAEKEREEEKKQLELKTIERTKKRPERLKNIIESLQKKQDDLLFELSFDDNTNDDIEFFTKELNECRRLLALYMA